MHGAKQGSTIIDMSTVSPKVTQDVAAVLRARGVYARCTGQWGDVGGY